MKKVVALILVVSMMAISCCAMAEEVEYRKTNIGDVWNVIRSFTVDAVDTVEDFTVEKANAVAALGVDLWEGFLGLADTTGEWICNLWNDIF